VSAVSTSPANQTLNIAVYNPSGTLVASGTAGTSGTTVNLSNLVAGTYTVVLSSAYAPTASAQVELQ
jgi:hypothetical protein